MEVPFHRASITDAEIEEVVSVLRSGWITTGPMVRRFEEEFAGYIGSKNAVALNSCTAGLHLAREALGISRGDSVIVPAMTFAATAEVVRYLDADPVFVDCREDDLNFDLAAVERAHGECAAQGKKVGAVIPVHYGGQVGDLPGLMSFARANDLKVVEDAAHCCPAHYRENADAEWQSVGTAGDVSAFSFYANKTITTGEGGMAVTADDALAERMRTMSLHGMSRDSWKRFSKEGSYYYEIVAPGFKYNLTDIAAAIGVHQLARADALHRERQRLARLYCEHLADVEELTLPREMPDRIHSWHLYVVRLRLGELGGDRRAFI
jgi:dTDP-4-amino-4,6-dideoxygalactose transaminase